MSKSKIYCILISIKLIKLAELKRGPLYILPLWRSWYTRIRFSAFCPDCSEKREQNLVINRTQKNIKILHLKERKKRLPNAEIPSLQFPKVTLLVPTTFPKRLYDTLHKYSTHSEQTICADEANMINGQNKHNERTKQAQWLPQTCLNNVFNLYLTFLTESAYQPSALYGHIL